MTSGVMPGEEETVRNNSSMVGRTGFEPVTN